MKLKDRYWNITIVVISVLIIGIPVDFKLLQEIDLQLYYTYIVISPLQLIFMFAVILISMRYFFLLMMMFTAKSEVLPIFLTFIFSLITLLTLIVSYLTYSSDSLSRGSTAFITLLSIESVLFLYFGTLTIIMTKRSFDILRH